MTTTRLLITILIINVVWAAPFEENEDDTLIAVAVLFRHGDRTPLSSWPTDPYFTNTSLWVEGYGQLNNRGKQHHYELGKWFRNRYDSFLPRLYSPKDIYVKSTDVDRTLMSAAANLAGLYTPEDFQVWNEDIPWQPIPIHTTSRDEDPILAMHVPCPKHTQLEEALADTEYFKRLNEENRELYEILSNYTGLDITDFSVMSGLYSTITILRGYNLPLPSWTEEYFPQISSLAAIHFQTSAYNADLARLQTGPFFNYLLNHFDGVLRNDSTTPKFLMLSGHDGTIGCVLQSQEAFNDVPPQFAATIIWELRRNSENVTYVNLLHKNSTDFVQMRVGNCSFNCEFEEFREILKPITVDVDTWQSECNL